MRIRRFLIVMSAAALAGCASDVTQPTVNVDDLVAQMSGSGIATYTSAALSASVPGATMALATPTTGKSSCSYNTSSQAFECAPIIANGITVSRSYQLLDASSHPLTSPDPTTIAALRVVTSVVGTFTPQAGSGISSVTIDRHEDATLSGIQTTARVLDGSVNQTITVGSAAGSLTSTETSTTSNLQLPLPSAHDKWPLGGTITTDRTISGSGGSFASHEVLSFNGTSIMTFTRTAAGHTTTCLFNMAKTAAPVCS